MRWIAKLATVIHELYAIALALEDAAIRTDMRDPAAGFAIAFGNRRTAAVARRQMIGRHPPIEIENTGADAGVGFVVADKERAGISARAEVTNIVVLYVRVAHAVLDIDGLGAAGRTLDSLEGTILRYNIEN